MIWLLVIVAFGVNLTVWAAIGFVRLAWDSVARHLPWSRVRRVKRRARRLGDGERPEWHVDIGDIAVLIPAHNEALVIADTITAIAKPPEPTASNGEPECGSVVTSSAHCPRTIGSSSGAVP